MTTTTTTTSQQQQIKIMSWNILANCWVKPEWFLGVDLKLLDSTFRLQLNVSTIETSGADIVFLQEVDETSEKILLVELDKIGYHVSKMSKNPTSFSPVANGTAIAIKKSLMYMSHCLIKCITFVDMGSIILKIGDINFINVHLDWQSQGGDKQLAAVLDYINQQRAARDGQEYVVIGDWNVDTTDLPSLLKNYIQNCDIIDCQDHKVSCFSATNKSMYLDHAVAFGIKSDTSYKSVTALPLDKQFESCCTVSSCLGLCGSDHLPIMFSLLL